LEAAFDVCLFIQHWRKVRRFMRRLFGIRRFPWDNRGCSNPSPSAYCP
jgi:hypothetical protein